MEEFVYHGMFDEQGLPITYFRSDAWPMVPDGAVELTEDQWREFIYHSGLRRWDGEKPVEYVPPAPEPIPVTEVTMRQAKIQLSRAGILTQADAAIQSMPGQQGEEARIEWQYATTLRRAHPLVDALGSQLGLSVEQIDELFEAAALID
ncbi:hypothetical protein FPY71_09995 [Aureimonas fodinaquatilis]|uniref:Uncharacterized protein n=1 Tax=Aureimonas fodinaquatilis TaxID=2565783 RepID=A0A5B0DVF1_9HYPH|nr:hypothetical protein [Aureimonas fodinaquatilis]KAA0970797.1 hypothetical protein FPY71_09995 [Aureimonas fodinaquatilis]